MHVKMCVKPRNWHELHTTGNNNWGTLRPSSTDKDNRSLRGVTVKYYKANHFLSSDTNWTCYSSLLSYMCPFRTGLPNWRPAGWIWPTGDFNWPHKTVITCKSAPSDFIFGHLFQSITTHNRVILWSYINVSKVWNYYVLVTYYFCLGFLRYICSLQIIYLYLCPSPLTIHLKINCHVAESSWWSLL